MNSDDKFETWAIIELFGHNQIAGLLSEQQIANQSFVRVDVPEVNGAPGFTKFYGNGAIYAITPCSEEIARLAVARLSVKPITIWMPEINRRLPPPTIEGTECKCCDYPGDESVPQDYCDCACHL